MMTEIRWTEVMMVLLWRYALYSVSLWFTVDVVLYRRCWSDHSLWYPSVYAGRLVPGEGAYVHLTLISEAEMWWEENERFPRNLLFFSENYFGKTFNYLRKKRFSEKKRFFQKKKILFENFYFSHKLKINFSRKNIILFRKVSFSHKK